MIVYEEKKNNILRCLIEMVGVNMFNVKKIREILIIILVLLIPILHEFGHFLGYIIEGVPATISYGLTRADRLTFLGVSGGLFFNVLLSIICVFLIYLDSEKRRKLWGAIGLASILSRLMNCFIIFLIGIGANPLVLQNNDEGQLAVLMGNNIIFQYIFFMGVYATLTLVIIKLIGDNKVSRKLNLRIIGYNLILTLYLIFN